MIRQGFLRSTRRLGLTPAATELDTTRFQPPVSEPLLMDLFGDERLSVQHKKAGINPAL
ncbi:MAG: hypothetical protein LUO80_04640 [Methylococcaceae bacterium]|jgi:hypothetical protein|nr:hypothetical protein [Methylococcaceae bacterium]